MQKLKIKIIELGTSYRKGILYHNERLILNTLEPKDRNLFDTDTLEEIQKKKVINKTAIPYGTYNVKMMYSPKFDKVVPHILNVKGFDCILIHVGNSSVDTEGCILVGCTHVTNKDWIGYSLSATRILNTYICKDTLEPIELTIEPK